MSTERDNEQAAAAAAAPEDAAAVAAHGNGAHGGSTADAPGNGAEPGDPEVTAVETAPLPRRPRRVLLAERVPEPPDGDSAAALAPVAPLESPAVEASAPIVPEPNGVAPGLAPESAAAEIAAAPPSADMAPAPAPDPMEPAAPPADGAPPALPAQLHRVTPWLPSAPPKQRGRAARAVVLAPTAASPRPPRHRLRWTRRRPHPPRRPRRRRPGCRSGPPQWHGPSRQPCPWRRRPPASRRYGGAGA